MDFLNGYNATAIVFGQTGSGKTYSMFGDALNSDEDLLTHNKQNNHQSGVKKENNALRDISSLKNEPPSSTESSNLKGSLLKDKKTTASNSHCGGGGGSGSNVSGTNTSGNNNSVGMVPRACEEILAAVHSRLHSNGIESQLGVSYIEVCISSTIYHVLDTTIQRNLILILIPILCDH